jgi:hypothetical protein
MLLSFANGLKKFILKIKKVNPVWLIFECFKKFSKYGK